MRLNRMNLDRGIDEIFYGGAVETVEALRPLWRSGTKTYGTEKKVNSVFEDHICRKHFVGDTESFFISPCLETRATS